MLHAFQNLNITLHKFRNIFSGNWIGKLDLFLGQTLYANFLKEVDKNTFILNITAAQLTIECQFDDDRKLPNKQCDAKVIVTVTGVEEQR